MSTINTANLCCIYHKINLIYNKEEKSILQEESDDDDRLTDHVLSWIVLLFRRMRKVELHAVIDFPG